MSVVAKGDSDRFPLASEIKKMKPFHLSEEHGESDSEDLEEHVDKDADRERKSKREEGERLSVYSAEEDKTLKGKASPVQVESDKMYQAQGILSSSLVI